MQAAEKAATTLIVLSVFILMFVSKSLNGSDFTTIDTAQLHSMVMDNAYRLEVGRDKEFTIIDARTKEEYDGSHIFSAISVPEKDFERAKDLLPRDKNALLVAYGNDANLETNRKWAVKAAAAGYTNIVIYAEGVSVWKEKHMPIAPP